LRPGNGLPATGIGKSYSIFLTGLPEIFSPQADDGIGALLQVATEKVDVDNGCMMTLGAFGLAIPPLHHATFR
jgi:hypothetical protein